MDAPNSGPPYERGYRQVSESRWKESEKKRSHHMRVGVHKAENGSDECDLQASAGASEATLSKNGKM